jgi:tellurite resistance-related uncharacterized protein
MSTPPLPYRSTPVFDSETLPPALRKAHSTKAGVWGRLDVLSGTVRYVVEVDNAQSILNAGDFIIIQPQQLHHVEPIGSMQMQVSFFNVDPAG